MFKPFCFIEMMSDEEVQKYARKSAILIAKMKDGSFKVSLLPSFFLPFFLQNIKKAVADSS